MAHSLPRFPNRLMTIRNHPLFLGVLGMLSLPIVVTLLAFNTLATTPADEIVAGTPLVQTQTPAAAVTAVAPANNLAATPIPPRDPNPIYRAGLDAFAAGEYALAETRFREALTIAPETADLHNSLGLALRQQGRLDEAVDALQTAVSELGQALKLKKAVVELKAAAQRNGHTHE